VSATTDSRAEVVKLARLLGLNDPRELDSLLGIPAAELVEYRDRVVALLHDDDQQLLHRMAKAAPLLPTPMLATIAERALGPLICARLVELLDPDLADTIARRLSTDFLAEVAAALDPRRTAETIGLLAPDRLSEVSLAMAAQGEHVAMGRIAGHLSDTGLEACIGQLADHHLLHVAFVIERKERLAKLSEIVGMARVQRILDGAEAVGMGQEALGLLEHLSASQRRQLRWDPKGANSPASVAVDTPPTKAQPGRVVASATAGDPDMRPSG
jgi:hypothetical protein